MNHRIIRIFLFFLFFAGFFSACTSTKVENTDAKKTEVEKKHDKSENTDCQTAKTPELNQNNEELPQTNPVSDSITLLFGGDIMAHTENYHISDYAKIWKNVEDIIQPADLAFANIEAPIDTTKKAASYPSFNMTYNYVQAVINAGFDVFSLCNNHTNDQGLNGIKETIKTTEKYTAASKENKSPVYFSGLKNGEQEEYSHNLIEKNGWKILFLPITELLNRPENSEYINFVRPDAASRKKFVEYCKNLRNKIQCDLFILSVHTSEPEYTRHITERQNQYYMDLLDAGIDVVWANHAHIIKDRKFVYNGTTGQQKIIMYANGNTISGQRREPELNNTNPNGERDNTGDGLLYEVTYTKNKDKIPQITKVVPHFITTYINTADEFVIRKLDNSFVNYLKDVNRKDWSEYIKRRIKINKDATKDYIIWQ